MKKKIMTMLLACLLMISIPASAFAQTKTLNTPYGTLTATLTGTGGILRNNGFKGETKLSETAAKLYIKVSVVDYLTGSEENSDSMEKTSTKKVSITVYGNDKDRRKTWYGTHEVRDTSSYVLYTTETQG